MINFAKQISLGFLFQGIIFISVAPKTTGAQEVKNGPDAEVAGLFARDNLVAWCIVPFDANRRGPAERAEMVRDLGLKKVAYDWRAEHVATFEEEILQYKKNGIDFFAFWSWHDSLESLIRKHQIKPQIWAILGSPSADQPETRISLAADQLMPLVERTKRLGLKFGLYNHGGWGGKPSSLIAVCRLLRERSQSDHVGIVYNFHHAHDDLEEFYQQLPSMHPYLFCVNLNGMADPQEVAALNKKILPVGSGKHEKAMMQSLIDAGYSGPIGVLDHRSDLDARESLQQNLDGLDQVIREWK